MAATFFTGLPLDGPDLGVRGRRRCAHVRLGPVPKPSQDHTKPAAFLTRKPFLAASGAGTPARPDPRAPPLS